MPKIKNIIFDLGGVLINIDYKKTEAAFISLGYTNFSEMYNQYKSNDLFELLEMGKISEESFYKEMIGNKILHATHIEQAWNAILLSWRRNSLNHLNFLRDHYNLYLLSNTNAIHQKAFFASLKEETGIDNFNDFFIKAYYSHEVQLRKPNEDIFNFVAKDADIIPKETLFIDDSYNNIETAKQLGFKTHLLLPQELIENIDYSEF